MHYILLIVLAFGGGVWADKAFFSTKVTAGACLDNTTKSIGEKYDDIMKIIKE